MPAIALSPEKPLEPITLEKRGVESPSSVLDFGEEPMKAVEIADLPAPEEEEEGGDDEEDDAGELAAWEAKIAEKLERSYHLPVKQLIELEKRSVRCRSAAVRARWPVRHIAIAHRTGTVPVTEASVEIAISSAHRAEALAACAFAIDELKAQVPIWKKEVYEDEQAVWKANREAAHVPS